jgi:fucose 4-O-acetylase-like acetyltransferase
MCWIVLKLGQPSRIRQALGLSGAALAFLISFITPWLWTTWRPHWLPWPIESYVDGVHNLGQPQAWLFPVFPWTAFAFAGLAVGFLLLSDLVRHREAAVFVMAGVAGVALICLARWIEARPEQLYPVYDYWHTSPSFFLIRVGLLLAILSLTYAWCRWGAGQWGFSPLIQLGQTSLLVYWVHFEFVYGRVSILPKHATSIRTASLGLLTICLAMLVLSILRTNWKKRGAGVRWPVGVPVRPV